MSTIGEQLKLARETRKLTIKQVVQIIKVRAHYLQAMEADDFSAMPSAAQARGFLRIYAEFLNLNADEFANQLRADGKPGVEPVNPIPIPIPIPEPEPEPENIPPAPIISSLEHSNLAQEEIIPAASQLIFNEIGIMIRTRRELISLTLDEIERHTRVRKHNLELIETGKFDQLPSPVQLRGILSAYTNFLDLDTEAVLLRYADAIQLQRIEHQKTDPPKTVAQKARINIPIWSRFISPDLIFGGSMILILLALSVWGANRIFSSEDRIQITPTQGPSISDVLLASPIASPVTVAGYPTNLIEDGTPFPTVDSALIIPSDTPMPTIFSSALKVTVIVTERTFLRVTVDGSIKQDGRVSPGAALVFDGESRIEILTGSGNAIQIIFNETNLGAMGNFGEVVNRIFTISGVETPTPTPSPTPSITPKPSPTSKPTLTLRPSSTPRPTSSPRPSSTLRPTATTDP
jgi:cytoskeleton protein RodZ